MEADRELRRRIGLGLVVLALAAVVGYIVWRFVAVVVFAVFLYYAVRPIYRSLKRFGLPRRMRAGLALVLFGVPFLVLVGYTLSIVVLEAQGAIEAYDLQDQLIAGAIEELGTAGIDLNELQEALAGAGAQASLGVVLVSLGGAVSAVSSALIQLLVLVVLTYYMLIDGPRLVAWVVETFDESGVLGRYVRAVDPELSLTLFGNIVNVFVTAIVGVTTFYAYNVFAPAPIEVPFPALVGALAGIGSLIPVVGIKLVYVPVTLLLAGNAWLSGDLALLVPVGILFAVSAVVIDFIPDFFIRALVSGDQTHTGLLMISYIVGPVVFGFYGLFLVPILLVLASNAATILLPYVLGSQTGTGRQSRLEEYHGDGEREARAGAPVDPPAEGHEPVISGEDS